MNKIFKRAVISSIICFLMTTSLIIINSIIGISIGLDYYIMLFSATSIVLTIGIVLKDIDIILAKKKKVKKVIAKKSTNKAQQIKRKKVS